jgi:hypothetical protein
MAKSAKAASGVTYDIACIYSVASAAAARDDKLPQAERSAVAEKYAARAVALLLRLQADG